MADVRETITHLYSLGRFDDVRVEAEMDPDGVHLRYRLEPIHTVTHVEFHGALGLPAGALRSRMVDRFGATPPVTRAADVAATLEQLYQDHGYLRASVRPAPPVLQHEPDRATLVFDVDAGPQARVGAITLLGSPLDAQRAVLSRLGLAEGAPYEPAALRRKLDDYVASMRHRGYYEAVATEQPKVSADQTEVTVTVQVTPGPLVTVKFDGDQLPKAKLADLVPIEREGSVDPDLIEDSSARIRDYLRQQGYWKADVTSSQQEQAGKLTIVFNVSRGLLYRVAEGGIEVTGAKAMSPADMKPLLKMSPGEPFVASRLDAIVGAIRAEYQARGYAQVKAESALNETAPGVVRPAIVVTEGPRTTIGEVTVAGNTAVPTAELLSLIKSGPGTSFSEARVRLDRDALVEDYLNHGYASAQVNVEMPVSPDGTRANLRFTIQEGPQSIVDHVLIVGNTKTDPAVIERELLLKPGKPLGLGDINESRRRLSALGLFRRVQISELAHGPANARDVVVTVEEAQQTTIGYGGGAQIDRRLRPTGPGGEAQEQFEFAPRGFFEVGRRNVGGRNRSVNLYTRVSLRPNDSTTDPNTFGFSEYRVVGTYRSPQALGSYGDFTATAAVEQGVRTSFKFARKGLNAELLHRVSDYVRTSGRYSFGTTRTFEENLKPEEQATIDRVFPKVRLSAFSGSIARDSRDDLLEPEHGTFLSFDGTVNARALGSQVGFVKGVVEGFLYRNLGRPHLVFATGARLGLANAFARVTTAVDENGNPVTEVVRDLPASERFFAGGDTTIRGYALDSVGAPNTISSQGFPIGGSALVILNAELRAPVWRDLGAAFFVDGGNVFARAGDLDLTSLRGSAGFGLRYRSPVGPVRLDLGFKLDRRTFNGRLEPRTALHFSIGEAF
jgi:outer membrane protein assembly complex protein YaeT